MPADHLVHEVTGEGSGNYRTVIDAVSYHHLSMRDARSECAADPSVVIPTATEELRAALNWIFERNLPSLCDETSSAVDPPVVIAGFRNSLDQNLPNPFHPSTRIRFSLARTGSAELVIYDVGGRKVRTLRRGVLQAGPHELVGWGR